LQKPKLVAVDSNILILLAQKDDLTVDAWDTIRSRIKPVQFIVTPTVIQELTYKALYDPELREAAGTALREMRSRWQCHPALLNAIQAILVPRSAGRIREIGLLPEEEKHDAAVLAEAAALDCALLITYDADLRDIDFEGLTLLLRELDLAAPVIATPTEVVHKFFH